MRFETWRGMPLVFATAAVGLALASSGPARADGYHLTPTLPREVLAYDYTTGGVMMAPPVPYGHYAKDGLLGLGCASCRLHGLLGCIGCGHDGKGHGSAHGDGCGACGGRGCGLCKKGHGHGGGGLFHHKAGKFAPCDSCVSPVVADLGPAGVAATAQSLPAAQSVVMPSEQSPCGLNGCGVKKAHSHHGRRCKHCRGKGCGDCGGAGMLAGCDDPGCGLCQGKGHGGGHGLGLGGGHGLGVGSKLAGLLHHQRVDYFLGAGGPVPLTPGYVPYIVATRSPRDYFAFPPMNPFDP